MLRSKILPRRRCAFYSFFHLLALLPSILSLPEAYSTRSKTRICLPALSKNQKPNSNINDKPEVTYNFTNRTPHLQLTRAAAHWLQAQIDKLSHIRLTPDELAFLKRECTYLSAEYLDFLTTFQLKPKEHVQLAFTPEEGEKEGDDVRGTVTLQTTGKWLDTILYEIPLLALVSEAYFKFCDRDWDYNGQLDGAREKGRKLLEGGCVFSEFGSRRRRDLHTHELVMQGLTEAAEEGKEEGKKWSGAFTGTSNVHLAMKFGVKPVGTVAHEWFMGVAAVTNNYEEANEIAIRYWVESYGEGVSLFFFLLLVCPAGLAFPRHFKRY